LIVSFEPVGQVLPFASHSLVTSFSSAPSGRAPPMRPSVSL
jgi:hypothetical protein